MNNLKIVHTKETIMISNNSQKQSPKSNPTERSPKSTQHTRRKSPTLTCKSSESQEAITLKSQVCIGVPPRIRRILSEHSSQEHVGVNASDLYNMLDMGGGVLKVFILKGTCNEINRN